VTMVAVDEAGKPRPVPALTVSNDAERTRFAEAERRMDLRRRTRATERASGPKSKE